MLDLNLVHGSHEQPGTRGITMEAVSPHAYGCDANEGPLGSIKRASDLWKWFNMIDAHIQLENSWKFKLHCSDRPDSVKPHETKVYPHLFTYSKNLKDTIKRQTDAKGIRFSKILFRSKILYQVVSFIISRPSIHQSFSTSHRFFSLITLTVQILHQRVDEVEASQTTCYMPTAF